MIIQCEKCKMYFDDEFRLTICSHDTFNANDGSNGLAHYPESWLDNHAPLRGFSDPMFEQGHQSEHDKYKEWLNTNSIKVNDEEIKS